MESPAPRMPRTPGRGGSAGFTLIELIVVMTLMTVVLFAAIPRMQGNPLLDDTRQSARWLIAKVRALRESAVKDQKHYQLHIDLDANRVWETEAGLPKEAAEQAALEARRLPEAFRIADVLLPGAEPQSSGRVTLNFYADGFADRALIHVREDDEALTLLIESFLAEVGIVGNYAGFDAF